jgi:hypothetical protein
MDIQARFKTGIGKAYNKCQFEDSIVEKEILVNAKNQSNGLSGTGALAW